MRSINKVIIIGNLTRDPVMKVTQSNQPVVTFGVATNRQWSTRDNQKHGSTEFHEVVAWAKLAEICDKYIRKGNLVYIEGYLKTRSWEDTSGEGKRYRTEVVVQDIIMLEKRKHDGEQDSVDQEMEAAATSGFGGGNDGAGFGGGMGGGMSNGSTGRSSDEPPLDELDINLGGLGEAISQDNF